MSNNWSIDPKQTGSINDGGSKLPLGKSVHKIVKVTRPINKQDQTGKEQQVLIETTSNGANHRVYLNPESASDVVANIARRTLVAFWEAAGLTTAIKPDRLSQLEGKVVVLDVTETEGKKGTKNEGKKFANIQSVTAYAGDEVEQEEEEPESEQEEAPPEEGKKKAPWEK